MRGPSVLFTYIVLYFLYRKKDSTFIDRPANFKVFELIMFHFSFHQTQHRGYHHVFFPLSFKYLLFNQGCLFDIHLAAEVFQN